MTEPASFPPARSDSSPPSGDGRSRHGCLGVLGRAMRAFGILLLLLLGIRELMWTGPLRPVQTLPEAGIVDVHLHVAGIGKGSECFVSREMMASYKYPFYLWAMGVTQTEVEEEGDIVIFEKLARMVRESRHVGQAVVLAMDGIFEDGDLDRESTQIYVPNDYVRDHTARYPELLYGASINPNRPDALQRLRRARAEGAVLVKWIPSIMYIDPASPALDPFYDALVELEMPLLTHTGKERSFLGARDELCDPLKLARPLERGVTVIAAHISTTGSNEGQDNYQRILPMFEKYPNLHADVSSLTQVNKLGFIDQALREPRLEGRLIYGTDWPLQFTPLVSPFYQPLRLTLSQMWRLQFIDNALDRDVELKQALGVPTAVFDRTRHILGIPLPEANETNETNETDEDSP